MPKPLQDIRENKAVIIDFSAEVFDEGDARNLAEALKNNTSARQLLLNLSNLLDKELAIIYPSLINHPSIDYINLSNNELTDESINYIKGLISNKEKLELNIYGNKFSQRSIEALEESISKLEKITLITSLPTNAKSTNESTTFFPRVGVINR